MAIKIGITGGIGSGKSVVSHLLTVLGIPVYDSDAEAKQLTATDPCIRRELTALLGEEVYRDGTLNKPLLAAYLFSDPLHAQQVNGIIHPRVKEDFRSWVLRQGDKGIVAMESAILIESGFAGEVDYIVMVYAPQEIRIERAMKRDGSSYEAVVSRLRSQMDDEEKRQKADYVIVNDGTCPLIPQVLSLLASLP